MQSMWEGKQKINKKKVLGFIPKGAWNHHYAINNSNHKIFSFKMHYSKGLWSPLLIGSKDYI